MVSSTPPSPSTIMAIAALLLGALALPWPLSGTPGPTEYERLARRYFVAWNAHDVPGLRALLADDVTLVDWDIEKTGGDEVAAATGHLFEAEPKISIDIQAIHVSDATKTAICEIMVRLHNAKEKVQKVAKLLTFDGAGKIAHVHAYKG